VPADGSGGGTKADRVAEALREQILESEGWENGHLLGTEDDLAEQYGVSKATVRRALDVLVGENLIEKGQGKVARVSFRESAYRFAIQLNQPQAGYPACRLAEPSFTFIRTPETDTEKYDWEPQAEVTVPRQFAALLGLEPHTKMISRSAKVSLYGELVLKSISYVPVELDDDEGWQDVEAGQLAVVGREVRSEFLEDEHRMPTPAERAALGMPKGILLKIISHRCQVALPDRFVRAGVIVLARADRVRLRWYGTPILGSPSE
jgi:Bacterial regulatory proteins, gntR family